MILRYCQSVSPFIYAIRIGTDLHIDGIQGRRYSGLFHVHVTEVWVQGRGNIMYAREYSRGLWMNQQPAEGFSPGM